MSSINFLTAELAAALARGVRQCVVIGSRPQWCEPITVSPDQPLQVFMVGDEQPEGEDRSDLPDTFVPTQFSSEALATALGKSEFDKRQASLFVWLGGAGYRTVDAAMTTLAFIDSLPKGSGVLFDYAVERTFLGSMTHTALDALASRILGAQGGVKHLIQPQAVTAMLRSLGFQKIVDLTQEELPVGGGHLVSAVILVSRPTKRGLIASIASGLAKHPAIDEIGRAGDVAGFIRG